MLTLLNCGMCAPPAPMKESQTSAKTKFDRRTDFSQKHTHFLLTLEGGGVRWTGASSDAEAPRVTLIRGSVKCPHLSAVP
ncbi:hypothetical protein E1301_Tti001412 [Triplophysa tibetana]|uniref:Uncharacterized protein n=1 Tax=Triplophysa tibetana TaxID=1572043 RepID=A0A5A9P6A0_9TELE|nr:hypothetical protein E1301_Tti001412 [Triplophysa tibetana]